MAEVDFSDLDSTEAWFEKQSIETRCAMSCRAALRVSANICILEGELFNQVTLAMFRALHHSAMRGLGREANAYWLELASISATKLALEAGRAVLSASDSALSFVKSTNFDSTDASLHLASNTNAAAKSVSSAIHSINYGSYTAKESAISIEDSANAANRLDSSDGISAALDASYRDSLKSDLFETQTPLWHGVSVLSTFAKNHEAFVKKLATHSDWKYWHDWYLAMWNGETIDWDFAIEVAKIPDDVWGAGFEAVGAEIRRRSEEYVVKKLPQIEEVFEDDDGLYDVRASITDPSRLLESVLSRLEFALETALKSNMCDLNEMSLPARILRHVIENCAEDPNSIEQYFREASAQIKSKVKEGQFAEDDELSLLVNVLDETALQLRADHPEVAAASEARVGQKLKEISDDKRLEIADSIDALQEGSAPRLAAEFGLAAETARDDTAPEAVASAIKKSGERSAKISMLERAKQAEGSGGMSSVKIGLRVKRVVELVMGLLGGGVG